LIDAVGVYFKPVTRKWVAAVHRLGIRVNVRGMVTRADYVHAMVNEGTDQGMCDDVEEAVHDRWVYRSNH
jgi:hypothetical protein